jgi:hypothetical protein
VSSAYDGIMLEIFQYFEQMTGRFTPSVSIVSGIVFLLLGLSIWLGGLALRKGYIAIAGLFVGCIVGLFAVGRNLFSASLTGALAMLSALILEKLLVVLLAAALAATVAFAIAAEPYFEQAEVTEAQSDTSEQATITEFDDIMYELKTFGLDAGGKIMQAGINMPIHFWVIIATPALIVLVCGVFLWRYTSALFFSVTGTIVAFFGMLLMLISKGTEPVDYVRGKPLIFAAVFLVMAAFGTIFQLLLCKKSKKQEITKIKPGKKNARKDKEPEKIVEHDWRSA